MAARFINHVLAALPAADRERLTPHLRPVRLAARQRLSRPMLPFDHVYFPDRGLVSVIGGSRDTSPVEIGIIGREGVVNLSALLGSDRSRVEVLVQVAGDGWMLEVQDARRLVAECGALNGLVLRCADTFMRQTGASLVAAAQASLSQRLARWLLMAHDRLEADAMPLTHEFLSLMLAVRRPSVTLALSEFERAGWIERRRGALVLLSRDGLVDEADGFYGVAEQESAVLFSDGDESRKRFASERNSGLQRFD
jgi:CRP-like cAMP-binding protein